jgi:hypothetical protein
MSENQVKLVQIGICTDVPSGHGLWLLNIYFMWVRASKAVQRLEIFKGRLLGAPASRLMPHSFPFGGEAFGVRQQVYLPLAAAFAREASFALLGRRQAAALQGACGANPKTMQHQAGRSQ